MGSSRRRWWLPVVSVLAAVLLMTHVVGERSDAGPGRSADPPHRTGCDQSVYSLHGTRQDHAFLWVVNVASIPPYLDRAGTLRAVRRATATMDRARTTCPHGRRLTPSLPRAMYDGPTEREANITTEALCFPPANSDGINVVSFGRLPGDVVAVTCTYSNRGEIWQSDIMLSDKPGLFTLDPSDGRCVDSYDLQSVMTHERGHSFGLAHVFEDVTGDHLTMSSMLGRCDASGRTLGWGDVLGLSRIY